MDDRSALENQLRRGDPAGPERELPPLGEDSRERIFVHSSEQDEWAVGDWVVSSWDGQWAADVSEARQRGIDLLKAAWQAETLQARALGRRPEEGSVPRGGVRAQALALFAALFAQELHENR